MSDDQEFRSRAEGCRTCGAQHTLFAYHSPSREAVAPWDTVTHCTLLPPQDPACRWDIGDPDEILVGGMSD